jgi:hypothetical protein
MGADLGEDDDCVDACQRGQHRRALFLWDQGPVRAFELADGVVAVEPNDEEVAEFFGALQIAHVAEMNQVETPVGGDDLLAARSRCRRPTRGLFQS